VGGLRPDKGENPTNVRKNRKGGLGKDTAKIGGRDPVKCNKIGRTSDTSDYKGNQSR